MAFAEKAIALSSTQWRILLLGQTSSFDQADACCSSRDAGRSAEVSMASPQANEQEDHGAPTKLEEGRQACSATPLHGECGGVLQEGSRWSLAGLESRPSDPGDQHVRKRRKRRAQRVGAGGRQCGAALPRVWDQDDAPIQSNRWKSFLWMLAFSNMSCNPAVPDGKSANGSSAEGSARLQPVESKASRKQQRPCRLQKGSGRPVRGDGWSVFAASTTHEGSAKLVERVGDASDAQQEKDDGPLTGGSGRAEETSCPESDGDRGRGGPGQDEVIRDP